jgi:DNA-directed RNA polymerase subunit M/transcription elongation factor TFIIS
MLSEKIELLGKGLYAKSGIPDILTLKSIPTATELDYVGAEDFDRTMIDKILPASVEESIPFGELLAIDYYWVCRGLRMLSYGPYYTTNSIFCPDCREVSYGEYRVDLRSIECRPLPDGFTNKIVISSDEFLDFKKDIELRLLTINEQLAKDSDTMFDSRDGKKNRSFANVCYTIKKIGDQNVTPLDVKAIIEKQMSAADYVILKEIVHNSTNFGLASGGKTQCPKCGSRNAAFMALIDDRFFRPTVGDLRRWKADSVDERTGQDVSGSKADAV